MPTRAAGGRSSRAVDRAPARYYVAPRGERQWSNTGPVGNSTTDGERRVTRERVVGGNNSHVQLAERCVPETMPPGRSPEIGWPMAPPDREIMHGNRSIHPSV